MAGESPTDRELEALKVLWDRGEATVRDLAEAMNAGANEQGGDELAYTTVQTMLNILHRKAKVKRTLKDRAYFYKPAVSRRQEVSQHLGDLVERLFGGSAESLVVSLLETKHLTPAKLARLNKLVTEAKEKGDESN